MDVRRRIDRKLAAAITRIGGKPLLRLSPHIYNGENELEQVAALIAG